MIIVFELHYYSCLSVVLLLSFNVFLLCVVLFSLYKLLFFLTFCNILHSSLFFCLFLIFTFDLSLCFYHFFVYFFFVLYVSEFFLTVSSILHSLHSVTHYQLFFVSSCLLTVFLSFTFLPNLLVLQMQHLFKT